MSIIIGTPHTKNAGYYMSGGPHGKREADIRTCPHCQAVIKMQLWKDDGGFCRKCNAPICAHCADRALVFGCEPFMQRLEKFTDAVVKYQQYIKVAGLEPTPQRQLIIP